MSLAYRSTKKFIPRAATTFNQKLSFGRSAAFADYARRLSSGDTALLLEFPFAAGPSHRVESAQLNAIASLATLFVTPLRCEPSLCATLLLRHGYPRTSDMNSTGEVAYCKTELLTRNFIGTWRQRNSARESTSAPSSNCGSRSASEASFGTSARQGNRVSAFRSSTQTSIISSSRENWLSTLSWPRRGHALVNMEDRVLDRFADHQSE